MSSSAPPLGASEAAKRLGVSMKALRHYERCGLIAPGRTAAGYRVYGPDHMAQAAQIVALRALGLSVSQVAGVLERDPQSVDVALAAHQRSLESAIGKLATTIDAVRTLRAELVRGRAPQPAELASLLAPLLALDVAFDLPWPWAGERFELSDIRPINYIVGPLGSGKTRFAQRLAEAIAGASFLGLERLQAGVSDPLLALLVGLEAPQPSVIVVDMVEEGLDGAMQAALMVRLRHRAKAVARPLFLMTRSSAILNLAAVGPHEAILFCPANHSPPIRVAPYPGTPGYEGVATCLASPAVRARTAGVIAVRRPSASSG